MSARISLLKHLFGPVKTPRNHGYNGSFMLEYKVMNNNMDSKKTKSKLTLHNTSRNYNTANKVHEFSLV